MLKDSVRVNIIDDNNVSIEEVNGARGRKCEKCKQYGHYAKTCQSVI